MDSGAYVERRGEKEGGSWMVTMLIVGLFLVLFKEVFSEVPALRRYVKIERM